MTSVVDPRAPGRDRAVANPVTVVSSDTHVGPLVVEQLRDYCPKDVLDAFDAYTSTLSADRIAGLVTRNSDRANTDTSMFADVLADYRRNARSAGHHDVRARLADMDRDGVACEVIFHASMNGEVMPFSDPKSATDGRDDAEKSRLEMEGIRIYNRWLADFCSVEPERHVGLCHVPMWDMDASVAEVVWAHERGLRGVNFPAPTSHLPIYQDPVWEPFFGTCTEHDMVCCTHIGGGELSLYAKYSGAAFAGAYMMENPWLGRRAMWLLTFAGVFDRHPNFKLVLTELPGAWWQQTVEDMDSCYFNFRAGVLRQSLQRKPSEYVATNVYMGASCQSRQEAEMAVGGAFDDRLMWGSDYPHVEGTWMYPDDPDDPSLTRLSLANTFHDLPASSVRKMTGENAIECYGLDAGALASIAARIGPDLDDLLEPPDLSVVPPAYHGSGFRTHGSMS